MNAIRSSLHRIRQRFRFFSQKNHTSTVAKEPAEQFLVAHEEISEEGEMTLSSYQPIENTHHADEHLFPPNWIKLAKGCISFIDELEMQSTGMDPEPKQLAIYVCEQLTDILEHSGVEIIAQSKVFDEHVHRPEPAVRKVAPGTAIAETLSPGFAIGANVLRRARVRLVEEH